MDFELKLPETVCLNCGAPILGVEPEANWAECGYCHTVMEITRFTKEEKRLAQCVAELSESVEAARREAEAAKENLLQSGEAREEQAYLRYQDLAQRLQDMQQKYQSAHEKTLAGWFRWGEKEQRAGRYDEAIGHFKKVLASCPDEAEVYWRIVLCRYGVEYVQDRSSGTFIPTLTRMQVDSILDDQDYCDALRYARSDEVRSYYTRQAEHLEGILRRYQYICGTEAPYDVFISVKQGDDAGHATPDSRVATRLYYELEKLGLKVFNSNESLLDKAGREYEPYIMHALSTANLLVVVASRDEYINAPWVRNEWRRFRWLKEQEGATGERRLVVYSTCLGRLKLPAELGMIQMIDAQNTPDPIRILCEIAGTGKTPPKPVPEPDDGAELYRRAMQLYTGDGVIMDREEAAELFEQAAQKDNVDALYCLGLCRREAGGAANLQDAVRCFRRAANRGHEDAFVELASCCREGVGMERNPAQAEVWLKQLASKGNARATRMLEEWAKPVGPVIPVEPKPAETKPESNAPSVNTAAQIREIPADEIKAAVRKEEPVYEVPAASKSAEALFREGKRLFMAKDDAGAYTMFLQAAEMGLAEAQYEVGECYAHKRGVEENPAEATAWYRRAAEQGNRDAQFRLGLHYYFGYGVAKNPEEAKKWLSLAAAQGITTARSKLAEWFPEKPTATEKPADSSGLFQQAEELFAKNDFSAAYALYLRAAEMGHVESMYKTGLALCKGEGVGKNGELGNKWFRKAANLGHAAAMYNLGWSHAKGDGVPQNWFEAVHWYTKAADLGYAKAQFNLGNCCRDGHGVKKDLAEAFRRYRQAADQGHAKAQNTVGLCYEEGLGVGKDPVWALTYFKRATENGHEEARENMERVRIAMNRKPEKTPTTANTLIDQEQKTAAENVANELLEQGKKLLDGDGVEKNAVEAVRLFRKAADQGSAEAMNDMGWCLSKGEGIDMNPEEAHKWFVKAAELGFAKGQFNVGYDFYWGDGVDEDNDQAFHWFRMAADQNHDRAQFYLGRCYENGYGTAKDRTKAIEWYVKSAEQGYAAAQNALGECHEAARSGEEDLKIAAKWYQKAAEQGNTKGMANYGRMLQFGIGTDVNPGKALELLHEASAKDNAMAMRCIGHAYRKGQGVAKNMEQAVSWYRKSAENGDPEGMYQYANCLYEGAGVEQNQMLAKNWYEKAAAQGNASARSALKGKRFSTPQKKGLFGIFKK